MSRVLGDVFQILQGGNVGLGTTEPRAKLDVIGDTFISGSISVASFTGGAISDSVSTTSSTIAASSTAVKTAYDLAAAALPRSGGTMTGDILTSATANVGIGTTLARYPLDVTGDALISGSVSAASLTGTAISDSVSTTSSTVASSSTAVKSAYDIGAAALPRSGGTMTGDILTSVTANVGIGTTVARVPLDVTGDVLVSGSISAASLTGSAISDSISTTSSTIAASSIAVKTAYDLAAGALPRSGGTMTGDILTSVTANVGIGTTVARSQLDVTGDVLVSGSISAASLTGSAISDSVSTTSSTIAASSTAVKSAYDLANAALPKAGGTMTGTLVASNIYIHGSIDTSNLTIRSRGALLLPVGSNSDRPTPTIDGYIRYNQELSQFEGYSQSTWGAIGGGSTGTGGFSPWSSNGSDIYYTLGNVGIGTSLPQAKLDVNGNALVSGDLTVSGCNLYITNGGVGIGTTTSSTVSQLAVNAETRLYKDITLSDRVDVGGYYSGGMRIRGVVDLAYDGENISRGGSKGHRGIEWYYANNNRWGMVQDSLYNLAIYTSSSVVIDDEGSAITFNKTNAVDNTSTTAFSEFGRFNYQGYLGIGTTRPTQKLHVQGDALISGSVSAASLTGTDITTSNLTVLNTLTLGGDSTALRNRLQVNSARKVFYVDTSTQSTFVVSSDGIFGGYSSNVDVFVNQNKLSYMTSNYADYDLNYAWTSGSNTDYTVTLTQAAVFGDIVDITIWPQIVQLSSTQPGYVYQNINLTYFNKTTPAGSDIYYLGNTGIGTTAPTQALHVQGDALVTGNLTVTGSNITNINYINSIEYNSSNVIINNVSGAGPALKVSQTGVGASYPIADFYDNDVSTTIPAFRIADGGNVGIGTATPLTNLHINGSFIGKPLMALLQDEKTAGTSGGNSVVGWQTRTLNTVVYDTINVSLSANQFTLPAGSYMIRANSTYYIEQQAGTIMRLRLYNVTDAAISLYGISGKYTPNASGSAFVLEGGTIGMEGIVTIAASKTFRVEHYFRFAMTGGLGASWSVTYYGGTEIYTQIWITRMA